MLLVTLKNLLGVAGFLLVCYNLYFAGAALLGALRRRRPAQAPHSPRTRFACLVAARNEAPVIGHLVDSLCAQAYPAQLVQVVVIPNNCTDDTAAVAAAHGARVLEPKGPVHSKGEALTGAVDALLAQGWCDAVCVFDADNLVDPGFLRAMDAKLQAGAQVVQGCRDSKNPQQSAMSGCCSIGFWMLNRFYNRSRDALGLSALVGGSGFAVSRAMLERLGGWHTTTMTEDYEFSAQCALAGGRVEYEERARIYDEQPITFGQSWRQRRRWTTGSLQGFSQYGGRLLQQALVGRSLVCADLYLTFLTPVVQALGLVVGAASLALLLHAGSLVLGQFALRGLRAALTMLAGGAVCGVLSSVAVAAVTVGLQKIPLHRMLKGIATFWVFLGSYGLLILLSFVHRETRWAPIAHTSAVSMAELERQKG